MDNYPRQFEIRPCALDVSAPEIVITVSEEDAEFWGLYKLCFDERSKYLLAFWIADFGSKEAAYSALTF